MNKTPESDLACLRLANSTARINAQIKRIEDEIGEHGLLVIHAMGNYGGSFVQALARAALLADSENFARIKKAFPEYWAKYAAFSRSADDAQLADLH